MNEIEKAEIYRIATTVSKHYQDKVRKLLFMYDELQMENDTLKKCKKVTDKSWIEIVNQNKELANVLREIREEFNDAIDCETEISPFFMRSRVDEALKKYGLLE